MYLTNQFRFKGVLHALGGTGTTHGGPGTLYKQITLGDSSEHFLEIDNSNYPSRYGCDSPVVLDEVGYTEYIFSGVNLKKKACVTLKQVFSRK